jgi:hypothetical protein
MRWVVDAGDDDIFILIGDVVRCINTGVKV